MVHGSPTYLSKLTPFLLAFVLRKSINIHIPIEKKGLSSRTYELSKNKGHKTSIYSDTTVKVAFLLSVHNTSS